MFNFCMYNFLMTGNGAAQIKHKWFAKNNQFKSNKHDSLKCV